MQKSKLKFRWLRRLGRTVLGLVILFIIVLFVFDYFVQFRMDDKALQQFFKEHNLKAKVHYYQSSNRTLRYVEIGNDSLPTLLFIHGSPSSLSIYKDHYKDSLLLANFHMLGVDRPGYGYSGLGRVEPSIQKQAQMIKPVLDSLQKVKRPVIIMAGSYGTSVACRLAMDNPHLVDGLVLVAPSLSPGAEHTYWFSHAIEHPLLNWFVPRMLQSANTEKVNHEKELQKMLPYWKKIKVPVAYIQGADDKLIDTSNASFARRQLVNAPYLHIQLLKHQPHFIAFTARSVIRKKIMDIYNRAKIRYN